MALRRTAVNDSFRQESFCGASSSRDVTVSSRVSGKQDNLATIAELLDLLQISSKEGFNHGNWEVSMGCRCEREVTLRNRGTETSSRRFPDAKTPLCTFLVSFLSRTFDAPPRLLIDDVCSIAKYIVLVVKLEVFRAVW